MSLGRMLVELKDLKEVWEELREKSDNGGITVALKNRISSLEYFCVWREVSHLKWLRSKENEDRRY